MMRFPDDVEALLGPPRHMAKVNLPRGKSADPTLLAETRALKREQRVKLEIANAKARGELLPAAEVEKEWASILRDVRAAMLALPSRLQQKLPHLTAHDVTTVDREIRDALTELTAGKGGSCFGEQTATARGKVQ